MKSHQQPDAPKPPAEMHAPPPTADQTASPAPPYPEERAVTAEIEQSHRRNRRAIETTISRMIAGWLEAERHRGHLTDEIEAHAITAIEQLNENVPA